MYAFRFAPNERALVDLYSPGTRRIYISVVPFKSAFVDMDFRILRLSSTIHTDQAMLWDKVPLALHTAATERALRDFNGTPNGVNSVATAVKLDA